MALYRCSSPSGGGGSSAVSGTTPATSNSGTITINTGLSPINRFVWFATASNTQYKMQSVITYDRDLDANTFDVAEVAANYGYHKRTIGAATDASLASLTSMSNSGTVVITTASGTAAGNVAQGYWFAE